MSLDNLVISPFLVRELYEKNLISDEEAATVVPKIIMTAGNIKYLGNNNRNILILVNEKKHLFLSDEALNFLIAILNACNITMDDAAIVNTNNNPDAVHEKLTAQFSPEVLIFFDTAPQLLDFPVQIAQYRVQQYNNQQYLVAPSLEILSADTKEKKQLWNALKTLFAIG